jgi:4-hydroxyacetophenone monooxygenase
MARAVSRQLQSASDSKLQAVLEAAHPMVLLGMLYHATGDETLRQVKTTRIPGALMDAPWVVDPDSLKTLRAKAFALLKGYRDGTIEVPAQYSEERLLKAMSLVADQPVPAEEYGFWLEELAIDPALREHQWERQPESKALSGFKVLVMGAGLGGLNAAIQLKKAGFNFQVLDKNPGVGGTWHQNRYPGARVDIPSRVYSHTCAMDYDFDHLFAPQKENERYTNWLADHFGIREHLRLSTEVLSLRWLEESGTWEVLIRNAQGEQERLFANAVISAVGFLDRPALAEFPGMKQFKGPIFHTTTFDSTLELADKRVAVIGTGASGMQLVPDLQPLVKHLSIFQRSPGWVLSMPGYRDPLPDDVRWLDRNVPYYRHWTRFSLAWAFGDHLLYDLWSVDPQWKDPDSLNAANFRVRERLVSYLKEKVGHRPDLLEKLLPRYPPLSKRYIVDNGWFEAVQKENVELIADDPIDHFTETAIITQSGRSVAIDVAVLATGFRANQFFWPMQIRGRGNVTVDELWAKDGARAFWGITIARLPNFFCLYGPNTNPKSTGVVPYGEFQVRYALKCLGAMVINNWKSIEVRPEAFEAHNRIVDERNATSIFLDKRQKSYYTNEFGRSSVACPWASFEYWSKLREPDFSDYLIHQKGQ